MLRGWKIAISLCATFWAIDAALLSNSQVLAEEHWIDGYQAASLVTAPAPAPVTSPHHAVVFSNDVSTTTSHLAPLQDSSWNATYPTTYQSAVVPAGGFEASCESLPSISEAATCGPISSDCIEPFSWFTGDYLYWRAHMRSLDYAAIEDGTTLAIGRGDNQRVDFDRDGGYRLELGHMTKVGWGIAITYTNYEADGVDSVVRPAGIAQLFPTLSHPGGPEEADTASAATSLDYRTFDLAARSRVSCNRFRTIDLFGGFRWADIDHELIARFNGRDFVNGLVFDRIEVEAFGLCVGGETQWKLAGGFSMFGRAAIAGLYGQITNTRLETNLSGLEQLVDFEDEYTQPIFNLETRLGIAKSFSSVQYLRNLQIRAGYDLNIWTGIGDRIRFSDDIEESAFSESSGDLLLEGFFCQAGIQW